MELVRVNGRIYFSADDGVHGRELWTSDGTSQGTYMVKDILPGIDTSNPVRLTPVGNVVFFVATDPAHGYELWKSDGTGPGTVLVKDIMPGPNSSAIQDMAASGGRLFFAPASTPVGWELWVSDGSAQGTHVLHDRLPNPSSGHAPLQLTDINGILFYSAGGLWRSDGTESGTYALSDPIGVLEITNVGGTVFFNGEDFATGQGKELWISDGTPAGGSLVRDILPGRQSGLPELLTNVNGTLFFRAQGISTRIPNSLELWKRDGKEEPG
jgi:ELWxxDGT repeat protein